MLVSQEDIKVSLFFKEEMIVKVTSKFHEFAGWRLWTKARMVNGDIKSRGTFTTPSRSDAKVVSKVGDILYSNSLRLTYRGTLWWRMQKNVNYMHLYYTSPLPIQHIDPGNFWCEDHGPHHGLMFCSFADIRLLGGSGKGTGFHDLYYNLTEKLFFSKGNPSNNPDLHILWWIYFLQGTKISQPLGKGKVSSNILLFSTNGWNPAQHLMPLTALSGGFVDFLS